MKLRPYSREACVLLRTLSQATSAQHCAAWLHYLKKLIRGRGSDTRDDRVEDPTDGRWRSAGQAAELYKRGDHQMLVKVVTLWDLGEHADVRFQRDRDVASERVVVHLRA